VRHEYKLAIAEVRRREARAESAMPALPGVRTEPVLPAVRSLGSED
jgi:hypothetical protein